MVSPYQQLDPRHFWKTGLAQATDLAAAGLYRKRFAITADCKIATAGSCFAQHISRRLRERGFTILDLEPAPKELPQDVAREYGYGIYSARFGNIYTVRHLLQLAREAFGLIEPAEIVWEKDGRFYDALRPGVEPEGLKTADAVRQHRAHHLARVRSMLEEMDLLIFTLGLTEGWVHIDSGTVYPMAPGVIAGTFDERRFAFKNFTYEEILADFLAFRELIRSRNAKIRFLLTVSPVPLTATASQQHVLAATIYSKSVLRAVAGRLHEQLEEVDYFPSYEIIASPFGQNFYAANRREVAAAGVDEVMRIFFAEHGTEGAGAPPAEVPTQAAAADGDAVCEEILLEAFAR